MPARGCPLFVALPPNISIRDAPAPRIFVSHLPTWQRFQKLYSSPFPPLSVSRDFILVQNVCPLPRILSGFSLCYVRESSGSRFSFFFSARFNPVLITSPTRSKSSVPKKNDMRHLRLLRHFPSNYLNYLKNLMQIFAWRY